MGSGGEPLEAAVQPDRVIADLREIQRLTSDEHGAQRVCWSEQWVAAREWSREKLAELPVDLDVDAAGNSWATLRGESDRAVLIGSHIDSVPNGGWLDGVLGLVAGIEVLRALAARGRPPLTVRLVDWADEEGARFGHGLVGSSAAAGTLDPASLEPLVDREGRPIRDVLAERGVVLERMLDARAELRDAVAYAELHIEQGPVLEGLGLPLGVVSGTLGVERHVVEFTGQAAHAGSTPMDVRRDALAVASRFVLAVREQAIAAGTVATIGSCVTEPGIATATVGKARLTVDQRHPDPDGLAAMVREARESADGIAAEEKLGVRWSPLWSIEPVAFDPELIALATAAVERVAGTAHVLPSGPLHDAAEVARGGVPTVMIFVKSLAGLSHNKDEDSEIADLELSVRALAGLVDSTMRHLETPGYTR